MCGQDIGADLVHLLSRLDGLLNPATNQRRLAASTRTRRPPKLARLAGRRGGEKQLNTVFRVAGTPRANRERLRLVDKFMSAPAWKIPTALSKTASSWSRSLLLLRNANGASAIVQGSSSSRRHLLKATLGAAFLSTRSIPAQTSSKPPALPPQTIVRMIRGYQQTQLFYVAAKLRIADILKDRAKTVAELAAAAHAHQDSLYRVLRTLASIGVFTEQDDMRLNTIAPAHAYPVARFTESFGSGVPRALQLAARITF